MARKSAVVQSLSRVGAWGVSAGCPPRFSARSTAHPTQAALADGGKGPQLLIGLDDDRQDNSAIQGAPSQTSLEPDRRTGGQGNDVLFGLNGSDVIDGGRVRTSSWADPTGAPPGGPPNSDIMFGGPDDDVNLWAPGDGSEVFAGGPGNDALIFGATDREVNPDPATGVRLPTAAGVDGFPQGIPTANVSGLTNFCTVEASPSPGYDYLVRFRNAAGNILATVRVRDVEQVFCSQGGSRSPTCRNRRRGSASSRRPRFRR